MEKRVWHYYQSKYQVWLQQISVSRLGLELVMIIVTPLISIVCTFYILLNTICLQF